MKLIRAVIVLQIFGILGSVIASFVEIESIVYTGLPVSLLGLMISILCYRRRLAGGFWFGLSVPSMAVFCFALIYGLEWRPQDAARPIPLLLLCFALLATTLGMWILLVMPDRPSRRIRLKAQYGISTLLILMTIVGVCLSTYRTFGPDGIVAGLVALYYLGVAVWVMRYYKGKGQGDLEASVEPSST